MPRGGSAGAPALAGESRREALGRYGAALRRQRALESHSLQFLGRQAVRLRVRPDLADHFDRHVVESSEQAQRLDALLDGLGRSRPVAGVLLGFVSGRLAALAGRGTPRAVLEASLALKGREAAAYGSLLALARAAADDAGVALLGRSLGEEEQMAWWLRLCLLTLPERNPT